MGPSSSDAESTLRGYAVGARLFGRFTLRAVLGRGGMGVVWRARDEVLGEEVALKLLPDAVRWDPGAFEDLKAETRRARQLTHPNIVRIHDFFEDATGAAIAMEWVDGCTLTALRLQRPQRVLEPAEMAPWLPQLGAALDHAHAEARVVHRDLKPSNLMLTRDGRLKVADFGVARSLADSVTRVSMMAAGTLVYMSPQQAMGEEPAPTDDVYALGATLFELLTGKPPFHTGDIRTQLFQRKPESIAARRRALGVPAGEVPAAWEAVIGACLAKEPARRPATAGEVVRRMAGESAGQAVVSRVRCLTPRRVGVGAVAAMVAIAAGLWFARAPRAGATFGDGAPPHPSDAKWAIAAWNCDGDGRDASGQGFDAVMHNALPTRDRFGRIDRALYFNGRADLVVPDSPLLRWSGAQPFTVAVWLKHDESPEVTGAFLTGRGDRVGSFLWSLEFASGRVVASLGPVQSAAPHCRVFSAHALAPGIWHHLAMVSDGERLSLFIDGREAGGAPLGRTRDVPAPDRVEVRFARGVQQQTWVLTGALDDAKLWRRALAASEVTQLAVRQESPRMILSRGVYSETEDIQAAVQEEFGPQARLLDWEDLKKIHGDTIRAWMDEIGLVKAEQNGWVQRSGQRFHELRRHYFVSRFDGDKPAYFLAHDEIGGNALLLGSWIGSHVPALAILPPAPITTATLHPESHGGVLRWTGTPEAACRALALTWRQALRARTTNRQVVRLSLADGRGWQVVCEPRDDAAVSVAVEGPGGVVRTWNRSVGYGEADFTLVIRDGRLRYSAVSTIGNTPWFNETVVTEGLKVGHVRALELDPGGGNETTMANLHLD